MSPRSAFSILAAISLLTSGVSAAQDFGLDLSEAADFRPKLAVLGVALTDESVPPEQAEKLQIDKLGDEIGAAADQTALYSAIFGPADVFGKISDIYGDALKCADVKCFSEVAVRLEVNQILSGQLLSRDGRTVLKIFNFVRFGRGVETVEIPTDGPVAGFTKRTLGAFTGMMKKAPTELATVKVESKTPKAEALLDDVMLGPSPGEFMIPSGKHTLKVQAEGHLADEFDLNIAAGEKKTIESNLMAKVSPPSGGTASEPNVAAGEAAEEGPTGPSIWSKPGLYIIGAGVVAIATGVILGISAKGIETRAVDTNNDGVLDISRRERNTAITQAMLANILVGAGGAAVLGGSAWLIFAPREHGAGEPSETASNMVGMGVVVSGRF